ncbi:condensation domain-containing protein [uncultured Roseobacter sp.]|uniref:non-ribosomal peptide synthetase n=1 Tax=uncultured Roseobacter sp. TaxID=114847 RepID=UPI0026338879|nr:condensation domain-containing protein [uncultured Roseobacter sp.]
MTDSTAELSTEEKRRLLRERLSGGRRLPRTYPASYSQRRLWFMHRLAPDSPAYNVEAALPLGTIDTAVLEAAINGVVERHGSLRTTFVEVDGEPVQKVATELHVPLEQIDLSTLPASLRDKRLADIRKACATEPFDLGRGPLVRTRLVRLTFGRNLLLLNLHHILADGWSMGIFSRELTALYEAFADGRPSPLKPLELQYGDFSAWQRREGDGGGFSGALEWWAEKLSDMKPLDFPTDFPRPAVQSYTGAFHNSTFPRDLTEALEAFSRAQGVTLFMTLLTGFKTLLARLSDSEDIAVGTYIANRERTEIEGMIGFFLNTLVLRTELPADATFAQALEKVRETSLGAYANQSLPFERLVEELSPPRDLSRNPLVQIVFQLQNATEDKPGGGSAMIDYQRSAAAFDLTVTAYVQDGQLHFTYEYATDLFERKTVDRISQRLEYLLRQAIAAPQTPIASLDVLLEGEHPRIPMSINATWGETPVTALFSQAAEEAPDAPAFYIGEACATIGQVAACVDRIAAALAGAGISKGDVVGVCLPRSVELAATLMAIWKTGAVYLPLDPAYPAARLAFMTGDAGASLLIVRHDTGEGLPETIPRLNVNSAIGDLSEPVVPFAAVPLSPEDPSHIIYTSGSTGQPRGAVSPHRQVLNRLHWMWQTFPHAGHEVEAVKTATSFIDSLWELAGPLIALRPATIVDTETLLEPGALCDQLAQDGVTRMWLTPSYLRLLLEAVPDPGDRLPQLTHWFITGEKLPAELARRFASAVPQARLFNIYGTSEAWDMCCDTDPDPEAMTDPVPVGAPISCVETVILDARGQPVPDGVPGELFAGGAAPCIGIVHDNSPDADRFVSLDTSDGTLQLLSTGDRARRRTDGRIEILGRMDDELKISGMRVHPAEVEAALAATDGVAAVAAAGVPGPDGSTRLWAWITAHGDADTDIAMIRATLSASLPAHMVPERIIILAQMPQTPSGKIDRTALVLSADTAGAEPEVPRSANADNELAQNIAGVFSEVVGHEVAAHENFFAAGGHSLLAARALARANDRFSLDLGIRDFFIDPTAAGLAERAASNQGEPERRGIRRIARGVRETAPPAPPANSGDTP